MGWCCKDDLVVITGDQPFLGSGNIRILSPRLGMGWMEVSSVSTYLREVK